ncbi:MAG TPA: filamentous hemagglutinin N-terminal domain-containing protein [Tepidisphaeraceae bacterium]
MKTRVFLLAAAMAAVAQAQVATDGTLGARQTFRGNRISIPAAAGQQRGGNLFHSFDAFDIARGNRVAFTGGTDVARVLARVTGGRATTIAGELASEIPGADLYLINPSGITIGKGATFDVSGTLAMVTADNVGFGDGTTFNAKPRSGEVLSSALPTAFGFLPTASGVLAVRDAAIQTGNLSLAGTNLIVDRSSILATGNFLSLTAARGEPAAFVEPGNPGFVLPGSLLKGRLSIQNSSVVTLIGTRAGAVSVNAGRAAVSNRSEVSLITAAQEPGSAVAIGAERLGIYGRSQVIAVSQGGAQGPGVVLGARVLDIDRSDVASAAAAASGANGPLVLQARTLRLGNFSNISSDAVAGGASGGDIIVRARTIGVGRSVISSSVGEGNAGNAGAIVIRSQTLDLRGAKISSSAVEGSVGNAGVIAIDTRTLDLREGAQVATSAFGTGGVGAVLIRASDGVSLRDGSLINSVAGPDVAAESVTSARGGIAIIAPRLTIDRSLIINNTLGAATPAPLQVFTNGGTIEISGAFPTGDPAEVFPGGLVAGTASLLADAGDSAQVMIDTGRLVLRDNGAISAQTEGHGRGGDVRVSAGAIHIAGNGLLGDEGLTGIQAIVSPEGTDGVALGDGGNLDIRGGTLEMTGRGVIAATTLSEGGAGNVEIRMNRVSMDSRAEINSGSGFEDDAGTGAAGSVAVRASDSIELRGGARVVVSGENVRAGDVSLTSGDRLFLLGDSIVSARAGAAGGNVALTAGETLAIGDSVVTAQAQAAGRAAQITLGGDGIAALGNSTINGLTDEGLNVPVTISNPTVLLAGDTKILSNRTTIPFSQSEVTLIDVLPAIALGRGPQLQASCADLAAGAASTFLVRGRDGVVPGYRLGSD